MVADEELAAVLGALIDEGRETEVARLISGDLADTEGLSEEDRLRIAAEITSWLFGE